MILCNIYIDLYTLLLLFSDLLLSAIIHFCHHNSICISNRHKAMANCYFAIFHFCIMMFIHNSAIASIPMFAIVYMYTLSYYSAILAILLFLLFCYSYNFAIVYMYSYSLLLLCYSCFYCYSAILAILLFLQFCYCVYV